IFGSAVWVVKATPLRGLPPATSQNHSLLETIGCTRSGDNCPYGFAIKRHGGGSWSCVPCDNQKYGSRYRDDHDEYYESRRYRDYAVFSICRKMRPSELAVQVTHLDQN